MPVGNKSGVGFLTAGSYLVFKIMNSGFVPRVSCLIASNLSIIINSVALARVCFSSILPVSYNSPTLTSIHDYWKNHSFDYTDLCWQSNISAF